ncbi:hypothetical protein HN018_24840 (plasmid) [Lichenicola cladoniae]|uniref:Uncharacterized protein n=1 Tax=Lichenicola cladoniae TaxID=1484109 RepID=A0A6M8HYK2_9PROT|nr:hypothetical protein [Lichenicola cladoniae]NPD70111.1 hypothetical protein [Acetobacteraceae bacterium]QKE93418.1 hypothetical protein HN018_24840 [Lichenicola cladoniae]
MISDHVDQLPFNISDPMVVIAPEVADQAFAAGVQFARALAGAEEVAFVLALGEQVLLIRDAIMDAGYRATKAQLAGEAFGVKSKTEWRRIVSPERPVTWGTA